MGSWDEVCIVCGISPSSDEPNRSGPSRLLPLWEGWQEEYVPEIIDEVVSLNNDDFGETQAIVSEALALPIYENKDTIHLLRQVMPGLGHWSGFKRCMAIGQFDSDGDPALIYDESGSLRVPDGRQVEIRLVEGFDCATFNQVLTVVQGDKTAEAGEFEYSRCAVIDGNPNFFVSEGCYHYLHAWIDWAALPSRNQAFALDPAPLHFGAELYEIVNSTGDLRSGIAALSCIDYDGITDTVEQFQMYFSPARRGSQHIAKAIRDGLRGKELLPAIMRDFRCWMFVRPDIWPSTPESLPQLYFSAHVLEEKSSTAFDKLPVELLLGVLHQIPLPSYLSLSSTCKSLRSLLTAPDFIDRIMKVAITSGHLRWILPVDAMPSEVDRAHETFSQWTSVYSAQNETAVEESSSHPECNSPCLLPHFPRLAFVHACFHSDSMMNRKRIWGIVKQYDVLWMAYRTNGWYNDRFYTKH